MMPRFSPFLNLSIYIGVKVLIRTFVASPGSMLTSVAYFIVRQRFKERMNITKPKCKVMAGVNSLKSRMAVKKIFKFFRHRTAETEHITSSHNVLAVDAATKYKELAEDRAQAARSAFKIAALELRRAERSLEDAEKYLQSIRSFRLDKEGRENHDFVLIEHENVNENDTQEVAISMVSAGGVEDAIKKKRGAL